MKQYCCIVFFLIISLFVFSGCAEKITPPELIPVKAHEPEIVYPEPKQPTPKIIETKPQERVQKFTPPKDPIIEKAELYLSKIVLEDMNLRTLASSITYSCRSGDKECQLNKIYRYVVDTHNYYSDPRRSEFIQTPFETIKMKGGDCEDLTILLTSLLENIGFKTYLVMTEDHAYALACGIDVDKLWAPSYESLIDTAAAEFGKKGDYSFMVKSGALFLVKNEQETIALPQGYVWYYGGDGSKLSDPIEFMNIEYSISSTQPLSIYFVPSKNEQEKIVNSQGFTHYPSCKKESIYRAAGTCANLGENGGIVLINHNSERATVNIDLTHYYEYSLKGLLPSNIISYYPHKGEQCVVLEATAGKMGYPGYSSATGKKTAIDPITKEYFFLE